MRQIPDYFGNMVRVTEERISHVLSHREMHPLLGVMEEAMTAPDFVRLSRSDETVRLFYRYLAETAVGGKWLCVVVKYTLSDAFMVTAYLTDKPKPGESIWPAT